MAIMRFFCLLACCLLVLPTLAAAATDPAQMLRDLHGARLRLHASVATFHRYQASEGDGRLLVALTEELVALKADVDTSARYLTELKLTGAAEQLQHHWQSAARHLNSAVTAISGSGFAEHRITNGYLGDSLRVAMALESAYAAVISATGFKVALPLQTLRDQALLMQEMSTLYSEQAAAPNGYSYRADLGNADTLDQMIARFSRQLALLEQQIPAASEAGAKLANVRSRWTFLQPSLLGQTEQAVPFLVLRYGTEIIADLSALGKQLDRP